VAKEAGVSVTSIYLWRKEFGYDVKMREAQIQASQNMLSEAEACLSAEDKFLIVVETVEYTPEELKQYCSDNNLDPDHVLQWRENCIRANETDGTQLSFERQQTRELLRENRRMRRELKKLDKRV
jgi:hypothetical protein